jgi:hypothetical protein
MEEKVDHSSIFMKEKAGLLSICMDFLSLLNKRTGPLIDRARETIPEILEYIDSIINEELRYVYYTDNKHSKIKRRKW